MMDDEINQYLGMYRIYSHKDDKNYDIKLLDPNTPGTNLGVKVCPTCFSKHKFQKCLGKSRAISVHISNKFLSRNQSHCTYCNVWALVFCYSITFSNFTADQCRNIASPLLWQIIPNMGFVYTISHVVLFILKQYDRCSLIKIFAKKIPDAIKLLLRHLRFIREAFQVILSLFSIL